MSRPRHFRSPSPTISMQSLYAARRPVRMSDKAKRTKNPPWRFCSLAAYLPSSPGPFHPGMRGIREKNPRCTSIKVRFGCVSVLTEWLILGDRTEAASYAKL
ncbi:hypothetical protein M405DRAFT_820944 [Rhizopogon salebrosus TDB-379]|nr:hypothetical protein M405DRAFT_820944 [Rhizopogon salebrosus TDB-379]